MFYFYNSWLDSANFKLAPLYILASCLQSVLWSIFYLSLWWSLNSLTDRSSSELAKVGEEQLLIKSHALIEVEWVYLENNESYWISVEDSQGKVWSTLPLVSAFFWENLAWIFITVNSYKLLHWFFNNYKFNIFNNETSVT